MSARRKASSTLPKKLVIVLILIIAIGGVAYKISSSLVGEDVLGTSTLLARGENSGPVGGRRERPDLQESTLNEGRHPNPLEIQDKHFDLKPSSEEDSQDVSEDVETEIEHGQIQIATDGGGFEQPNKHLGAISHFPITIDTSTNSLIITTPAGTKTVTVLPDRAIQNIINRGIISKIGGHVITSSGSAETGGGESSESGVITTASSVEENTQVTTGDNIELTVQNGSPVYKVKGSKSKKFFGLIPVSVNKTVTVSAETGEVQSTQLPLFDRFLDVFSL